jgi:hypothetical protein
MKLRPVVQELSVDLINLVSKESSPMVAQNRNINLLHYYNPVPLFTVTKEKKMIRFFFHKIMNYISRLHISIRII